MFSITMAWLQVELRTLDGLVKDSTQCAPNGYYFVPVYDKVLFLLSWISHPLLSGLCGLVACKSTSNSSHTFTNLSSWWLEHIAKLCILWCISLIWAMWLGRVHWWSKSVGPTDGHLSLLRSVLHNSNWNLTRNKIYFKSLRRILNATCLYYCHLSSQAAH